MKLIKDNWIIPSLLLCLICVFSYPWLIPEGAKFVRKKRGAPKGSKNAIKKQMENGE